MRNRAINSIKENQISADPIEKLIPLLVYIQANLDQDLSLETLASRTELSPFHFHRLFQSTVGETLKRYTQRLRLERAAIQLVLQDATILNVALDSGFHNHETFSREFKRRFQITPRAYRRSGRRKLDVSSRSRSLLDERYQDFELSRTKVIRLSQLHLAFIRHVGSYEAVSDKLWHKLTRWAKSKLPLLDLIFLGIAHDAPGVTPPEKLRFDAAIVVPEPFSPEGAVGCQLIGPADFAVTTHVGHFNTLPKAYATLVHRIGRMKGYRLDGVPTIEVYRTTHVDAHREMNHTEIYIPVSRTNNKEDMCNTHRSFDPQ